MASDRRFIRVHKEGIGFGTVMEVFVDSETRVQYLFYCNNPGGGMTALLDPDGKPLLYQGNLEDVR